MHPSLVIFDVDGLMLDTEARWQEAWHEIGLKYGIKDLGTTTFLKCVGLNGAEVESIIHQDLNHLEDPLQVLKEARHHGLIKLQEHIDLKPGLIELLEYLKLNHITMAVATSTNRDLTMERLKRLGIIEYFDHLICGDEVTLRKPNPEIYLKVIQHFNIKAKDALILEDSLVGVEAAYRAQIPCIMIPDLVLPTKKQIEEANCVVSSLFKVIELLER